MNYWLVKSDPDTYGWEEMVADKTTFWDGVRNYAARNFMREMKKGDQVLFYHSQSDKEVIGIAKVSKEAYQDPTTDDDRWSVVDLTVLKALRKPVSLAQIKAENRLSEIYLVKQSRLSVMPLKEEEFHLIIEMGK